MACVRITIGSRRLECGRVLLQVTRYLKKDRAVVYNTLRAAAAVNRSQLHLGAPYIAIS
jgi:hypothetical protein